MQLITNWIACLTLQGVIVFVIISNRPHAAYSSDFEIIHPNYSLNCTPLGPVTTTYYYNIDEVAKCQLPCLVLELFYKPWSYSFMTREIYQVQYLATLYKCKQILFFVKKSIEYAHSWVEKLRIIFCFAGDTNSVICEGLASNWVNVALILDMPLP